MYQSGLNSPRTNISVEPRKGRVSMFTSGAENPHFVERVSWRVNEYIEKIIWFCITGNQRWEVCHNHIIYLWWEKKDKRSKFKWKKIINRIIFWLINNFFLKHVFCVKCWVGSIKLIRLFFFYWIFLCIQEKIQNVTSPKKSPISMRRSER